MLSSHGNIGRTIRKYAETFVFLAEEQVHLRKIKGGTTYLRLYLMYATSGNVGIIKWAGEVLLLLKHPSISDLNA